MALRRNALACATAMLATRCPLDLNFKITVQKQQQVI
jgi:hypothetical protein